MCRDDLPSDMVSLHPEADFPGGPTGAWPPISPKGSVLYGNPKPNNFKPKKKVQYYMKVQSPIILNQKINILPTCNISAKFDFPEAGPLQLFIFFNYFMTLYEDVLRLCRLVPVWYIATQFKTFENQFFNIILFFLIHC